LNKAVPKGGLTIQRSDEPPHVCYEGVVFIGHVIEEAGEGVEVIEDVNCKRCRGER